MGCNFFSIFPYFRCKYSWLVLQHGKRNKHTCNGRCKAVTEANNKATKTPIKLGGIDDRSFTQPLGRIKGQMGEFQKSLEASNARVIAFGASAGAIMAIQQAFKSLVTTVVNVEKKLAEVNVILGTNQRNLSRFGSELFSIAKKTEQSFDAVATAATELARQGLGLELTLKEPKTP